MRLHSLVVTTARSSDRKELRPLVAGPGEMGQRPEIPGGTLHASLLASDMPEGSFSGMCPESQIHRRTEQSIRGTRTMSGGVCDGAQDIGQAQ